MKKSLGTQLSFGFALIILVSVAVISLVSNLLITKEFESFMQKQQEAASAEIAEGVAMQYVDGIGWNVDYIHGMGMYALNDGYILKVYDAQGEVVWDAENHDMENCHQMMQDIQERMEELANGNGQFVTRSFVLWSGGVTIGEAEVTYYTPYYYNENAFRFVDALNLILLIIGVMATISAVCVGILFARKIARPIMTVTSVADEIANGNYDVRTENKTNTAELSELSSSINKMAEKLNSQEALRKQLTSDVAHELRTPLTNVSSQLEVILEGVFEPTEERLQGVLDEINRISSLVTDLEKLQQIESTSLEKTDVDLLELTKDAVQMFEAETAKKNLKCSVSGDKIIVPADERKLRQVITNLMSNAIKYSFDGGEIVVSVKDSGTSAVLSIKDNGIGISDKDIGHVFERFYRTDKSRNRKTGGVGIGLTIVNAIVKAHGGTIEVDSTEGKGSTFIVKLPKN